MNFKMNISIYIYQYIARIQLNQVIIEQIKEVRLNDIYLELTICPVLIDQLIL